MATNNALLQPIKINDGEVIIRDENPANDFRKLVADHCVLYDEIIKNNFDVLLKQSRKCLWKLIFNTDVNKDEALQKAYELLREVRKAATNYGPEKYNALLADVRTEMNVCDKFDLWQQIVAQGLGLIFPDADGQPIADVVVTFPRSESDESEKYCVPADIKISFENPVNDFENLIKNYSEIDAYVSDRVLSNNFHQISSKAMLTIWEMLFGNNATVGTQKKAIDLLESTRSSCCFHSPYDFNDWIPKVRDELLKKNMIELWRDGIVKRELGLIGARNSDYFDDLSDPKPAEFYEYAGCKAPFSTETYDSD